MNKLNRAEREFAAALKEYRLEREWTLQQMANVIGVTNPTIHRIENGAVRPHERTVRRIKKALPNLLVEKATA